MIAAGFHRRDRTEERSNLEDRTSGLFWIVVEASSSGGLRLHVICIAVVVVVPARIANSRQHHRCVVAFRQHLALRTSAHIVLHTDMAASTSKLAPPCRLCAQSSLRRFAANCEPTARCIRCGASCGKVQADIAYSQLSAYREEALRRTSMNRKSTTRNLLHLPMQRRGLPILAQRKLLRPSVS